MFIQMIFNGFNDVEFYLVLKRFNFGYFFIRKVKNILYQWNKIDDKYDLFMDKYFTSIYYV